MKICQNSKHLTQNADSTIYMARMGSQYNCPDGLCAARGSAANPVETVEEALKLAVSSQFRDKAISIVVANGNYDWGGLLGQKRIDIPRNITHIICNEGFATFGRPDDRRTIGFVNHPFLAAFGLVLHADIEANSDEGESVLNKVAGRLFGKYILKAEKKGKLSVTLDNITQVIERDQLRDKKWDNEYHVKDVAKLIIKIKNTDKKSLFGRALVMGSGDGEFDSFMEDGTCEDRGCSSVFDDRCKARNGSERIKFLMRGAPKGEARVGSRDSEGFPGVDDAGYWDYDTSGRPVIDHIENRNMYEPSPEPSPGNQPEAVYMLRQLGEFSPEPAPTFGVNRQRNMYLLPEGTMLEDFEGDRGQTSVNDDSNTVSALGTGQLAQYKFGGSAQFSKKDLQSIYDAAKRVVAHEGFGDAKMTNNADGVKSNTAGGVNVFSDNANYKQNQSHVRQTCVPTNGYYSSMVLNDAAQASMVLNDVIEEVCQQSDRDAIYSFELLGSGTLLGITENGGKRILNLTRDPENPVRAYAFSNMMGALDLQSINTIRQYIAKEAAATTNSGKAATVRALIFGEEISIGPRARVSKRKRGTTETAMGFLAGDSVLDVQGNGEDTDGQIGAAKLLGGVGEYRESRDGSIVDAGAEGAAAANYGKGIRADVVNRTSDFNGAVEYRPTTGQLIANGNTHKGPFSIAAQPGDSTDPSRPLVRAILTSSLHDALNISGPVNVQLDGVQAASVDLDGGEASVANSRIDKLTTLGGKLSTSLSRITDSVKTDGTCVSHAYSKVEGEVKHIGECIIEHLFSEFEEQVLLEQPVSGKILNFIVSSSKYGNKLHPEVPAVSVDGVEGGAVNAVIGAIQTKTRKFMEKRLGAGVIANVIAGEVAVPAPEEETVKYVVDRLLQKRNDAVNIL